MTKTLIELARMTDDEARAYLESLIWPHGPVCPHCGSVESFRLNGESHRPGLLKCKTCREQFTVTVGSMMEDSHIPLPKWVLAFHFLCSSKKGMSAKQLQRELGFGSYETAWFMSHRIREAMATCRCLCNGLHSRIHSSIMFGSKPPDTVTSTKADTNHFSLSKIHIF